MRHRWSWRHSATALLILTAAACAAEDDAAPPAETVVDDVNADNNTANNTTANNANNADPGNNATPAPTCDREGFTLTGAQASILPSGGLLSGVSGEGAPYDVIELQIFDGESGPTAPGTYTLEDVGFDTCTFCVVAYAGCGVRDCEKTFYAREGQIEITSLGEGEPFAANFTGLVLDEVTVDEDTYAETKVEGGERWCVDALAFDEPLVDPVEHSCVEPTVNCIGEQAPSFALQNCESEEHVELAVLAEGKKVLWLVASAGWCPACAEWLPEVRAIDLEQRDGLEIVYIMGQDGAYAQPSLDACRDYAERYAEPASFYVDHDGEYAFAQTFDNIWFYPDDEGGYELPWQAVLDAETLEILWAGSAGTDGLMEAIEAGLE